MGAEVVVTEESMREIIADAVQRRPSKQARHD